MVFRITERAQRDQTIEHRRINRGEAVAPLTDSFQHPALRFFKRAFAHRTNLKRMQNLQDIGDPKEKISPSPKALAARQTQIALLGADRIELVQLFVARQGPRRLKMVEDRER